MSSGGGFRREKTDKTKYINPTFWKIKNKLKKAQLIPSEDKIRLIRTLAPLTLIPWYVLGHDPTP